MPMQMPWIGCHCPAPDETSLLQELVKDTPAFQIAQWTRHDPLMIIVTRYILEGWPESLNEDLQSYWTRRMKLSTHDGWIVWGNSSTSLRASIGWMEETQACQEWKLSHKDWYGGQAWTTKSRRWLDIVVSVSEIFSASVEVAYTSVGMTACGFCRSYGWQNVFNSCWCTFQVIGSVAHDNSHSPNNDTPPKDIVWKVWSTWVFGIRQWSPIFSSRVFTVL